MDTEKNRKKTKAQNQQETNTRNTTLKREESNALAVPGNVNEFPASFYGFFST